MPYPDGPTCPCNVGPLCRHHHRIKQQGWTKHRRPDGAVRWMAPSGESWLNPSPHQPPAAPVRPLPPVPQRSEWDLLSPLEEEAELYPPWLYDDPAGLELRAQDREPADIDLTRQRILTGDTRWTLDLHNPYAWL